MRFEFATAGRILFGPGSCAEVAPAAHRLGRRALVVVSSTELAAALLDQLRAAEVTPLPYSVRTEPTIAIVQEGLRLAHAADCQLVISIGGGSVMDTGKAVAALLTNPGDIFDYLEIVGAGRGLENQSAAHIAVPTTAGTGSEVTRNAVLTVPEKRLKVSLRSPYLLPVLAIVDPELTCSLPPDITASTGLDALTQLIEPFVSTAANPVTDAFCRLGLIRAARSLQRAYEDGHNVSAREDMTFASLCGGLALANARLGAVHGFAGPIGGMFPAPHGSICARLLPYVMEANLRVLHARSRNSPVIDRYAEVAQLLTGNAAAKADDGIEWIRKAIESLDIPPLSAFGITRVDFPAIVEQARKASSMKGNPVKLTDEELTSILESAL